jgi:hypothetical protein
MKHFKNLSNNIYLIILIHNNGKNLEMKNYGLDMLIYYLKQIRKLYKSYLEDTLIVNETI